MANANVQLTKAERAQIDNIVRTKQMSAIEALRQISTARKRNTVREVEKSSVDRYVRGLTHKPHVPEKRGRKRSLSKKDVRSLDQARRRLIKRAENEERGFLHHASELTYNFSLPPSPVPPAINVD